jgi:hypothetical protein
MSYVLSREGSSGSIDELEIADQRIFSPEEMVGNAAPSGAGNVLASM